MSSEIILKVENIGKQYRLGLVGTGTISHDLNRWWNRIRGKEDPYLKVGEANDRSSKGDSDYVWAIKDINFEVKRGEVLGIIGKNGAGKSTLLKILSRVTGPTTGQIKTKGRIASLLEVGTGFHPEMTGRENIYLNGAILGMTKAEINSKIDEIIDFSGCLRYVDTPVKRYSSGMKVRLAFAVAAHLEPDILVVDEVLAVGDAEFQKKAIGKMQDISHSDGRTVLFVSHNMAAVKSLCTRAIVLEHGTSVFEGGVDEAISYYLNLDNTNGSETLRYFKEEDFKEYSFFIQSVGIKGVSKNYEEPLTREDHLILEMSITKHTTEVLVVVFRFKDGDGNIIFVTNSNDAQMNLENEGKQLLSMHLPNFFFNEGNFSVDAMITNGKKQLFFEPDCIQYTMLQEAKKLGDWMGKTKGALKPKFEWLLEYES
ncbi:ATP-binding cassette domain-containing protein [Winogradskyella psychrotolerans]|uniref:ABC transporter ATP-binding protein n=1 Tax=Winogradskyella psychrotolerans TaxID=1344585 RepID=UPI001C073C16|nr:polysaccharide ABC transporter ATP-binding protein [Winogradskyella psychrotolerans]MBU2919809.1 ATP-binding cassette domain-containing protein [Winogradskyella psychrotolerans]